MQRLSRWAASALSRSSGTKASPSGEKPLKRVCILSRHPLFCKGIEALLAQEPGLEIVNWGMDFQTDVERIRQFPPDVVLVDFDDPTIDLAPTLLCMLRQQLGFCVIGLSLNDNRMTIFHGEHKEVFQVDDLLKVIHG